MFATWQDVVVAFVALGAAVTVVWRTLGAWSDSTPGGGVSGCDHCPVKDEALRK
jgi:hypothetical protein